MQATQLLQNVIKKACDIHKKRLEVLLTAAETLVKCCRLSVVGLGRGLINGVKTKYNINRMDRLISNEHLYTESLDIQRATASLILGSTVRPVIVVDWSSATVAERYQLLRAGVPVGGRTLTIYEEVHVLKKYNNPKVHKRFLKNLSKVLPESSRPIVVTDAGFGIPWFKQVVELGWDYVGRIINKSYYTKDGKQWNSIPELLAYKSSVIKRLGKVFLAKKQRFSCYLQAYKALRKGRIRKNSYGEKASRSVSKKSAKSGRQAWVLAHSLGGSQSIAQRVIKIYKMRMQIEESFRDIKNPQFGFGLRYSRSLGIKRLTNLFLIGLLGTLMAWLLGLCAKSRQLQYALQTNSIKQRNVLSVFFIGCQIIWHPIKFVKGEFLEAIKHIREVVNAC
jgi:hypothetical protein